MNTTNIWKKLSFLLIIMIGFSVIPAGRSYSQASEPEEGKFTSSGQHGLYLPIIFSGQVNTTALNSPFSVQLAGAHDAYLNALAQSRGLSAEEINVLEEQALAAVTTDLPPVIAAIKELGVGWVRVYIDWAVIEPVKGNYQWGFYDQFLGTVASAGVNIIATISNPPAWAQIPDGQYCDNRINSVNDYVNFVTALVNRYQFRPHSPNVTIRIHTWEILNEPDMKLGGYACNPGSLGGKMTYGAFGAQYADLAKQASQAIKAADPYATVIMGGIAYDWFYDPVLQPGGQFIRSFIDDVMMATKGEGLDALNFHFFTDHRAEWERWSLSNDLSLPDVTPNPPFCPDGETTHPVVGHDISAKLTYLTGRMQICHGVKLPIWITEVGHHGIPNDPRELFDLDNQARYVFTVYARSLAHGAANITWYAIKINEVVQPTDHQGLLDKNNNPKRAYFSFQTLIDEITDFKYNRSLNWGKMVEAYVFRNPKTGEEKIIAWVNPDRFNEDVVTPVHLSASNKTLTLVYPPNITDDYQPIPNIEYVVNGLFTLDNEPVIIKNYSNKTIMPLGDQFP